MKTPKPDLRVGKRDIEIHKQDDLTRCLSVICTRIEQGLKSGKGVLIKLTRPKRTSDQNDKMWAMLHDIEEQVKWSGRKLIADEWKILFTAVLMRWEMVPGLEGGFVMLGQSTREMTKQQLSDIIELMYAFGAERGVIWSGDKDLSQPEVRDSVPAEA